MNKNPLKFVCALPLVASMGMVHAAPITYGVSIIAPGFNITGYITTDGTLGQLSDTSITSFDLFDDGMHAACSQTAVVCEAVNPYGNMTADAQHLYYNFDNTTPYGTDFQGEFGYTFSPDYHGDALILSGIPSPSIEEFIGCCLIAVSFPQVTGNEIIASNPAYVPLPPTLSLLGSGLLGFGGVMRKYRQARG